VTRIPIVNFNTMEKILLNFAFKRQMCIPQSKIPSPRVSVPGRDRPSRKRVPHSRPPNAPAAPARSRIRPATSLKQTDPNPPTHDLTG